MKKTLKIGLISIITVIAILMSVTVFAAKTVTIFDGKVTITDSIGNGSGDASKYTATAKGGLMSKKSNTITIVNETGKDGTISFDYTVDKSSAFTINGGSAATSEHYSAKIASGGEISIVITSNSGFSNLTVTLTISNITFEQVSDSSDITYEFDDSLGTVTAGGTAIASGDVITVDAVGAEMIATPKSGATFIGWVNSEGLIVSADSTYIQQAFGNDTVTAIFSNNTVPYYEVDSKYIFSDLDDATAAGSNLVLLCNATLPAGNYTIPAGKTLHIPMDATKTLYTTTPASAQMTTYKAPTLYRKLTLNSGANFIVNGAISVAGKLSASQGSHCSLIGTYGQIDMKSGSTITINNGATLYAWGYITGSGSITAKPGATVYEPFQVRDWRGGTAVSSDMLGNKKKVFPMSQYYVQNVEVALTLESGAVENGFMCMFVTGTNLLGGDGIQTCGFTFIGKNEGMFRIDKGSITKDYDENTDRLVIDIDGTLSMSPLSISMKITVGLPSTINSESYTLPVNGNITLHVNDGSTINISQEMALLPGGEIYVHEGAKCNFANDLKAFIYDSAEWGAYCGHTNKKILPACHSVGRKYTRTEADLVDAFICVEGEVNASGAEVYTTASGANIIGAEGGKVSLAHGADTVTYQVTQSGSNITAWNEIPVTVAQLKNAGVDGQEGTYVKPETLGDCGKGFTYINGVWEPTHTNIVTVPGTPATCTATGLTEGQKCETCGTVIKEQEVIPVETDNHVWDAGVITTPATSETPGVMTYTCTACSTTKTEEIPAISDPCAGGHAWDTGVVTTEPTHTVEGVKTFTCGTCGTTNTETVEKLAGHTYTETITKAATCEEAGVKTFSCECGDSYTETIAATGHAYDTGVVTTPATCTTDGVKTYTCKTCGDSYTETIAATGHAYDTGVVTTPATCTTDGVKTYTCKTCGDSYTETIAATGHAYDAGIVTTPATHTVEGVKTYTCGNCNGTKTEAIAKLTDHEWGTGVITTPATHTTEGVMTYTCTCGEKKTEPVEKLAGHTYTESITKAATCEEAGVKTFSCECGDSYTEEIPATGHSYDAGVITTPATHIAEGVKTFTCGNCGETYTETIEKTAAHEYGEWAKVDGRNHARECICGYVETKAHEFEGFACTACGADKIVTISTYSIANGEIKINSELVCEVPEGTQIIVAVYNAEGQLINAKISAADELAEVAFASAGVAQIRVFAWSGFSLLSPISLPEIIRLN